MKLALCVVAARVGVDFAHFGADAATTKNKQHCEPRARIATGNQKHQTFLCSRKFEDGFGREAVCKADRQPNTTTRTVVVGPQTEVNKNHRVYFSRCLLLAGVAWTGSVSKLVKRGAGRPEED